MQAQDQERHPDRPDGVGWQELFTGIAHLADVAATILSLLGFDVIDFNPAAGSTISATGADR